MKQLNIILAAAFTLFLASCDNVSEPDRFLPVDRAEAKRVVLIEEYTGQFCTNCPKGHAAIHNLLSEFPTEIVAVSIHASSLALPEPAGLAIPAGEVYYKDAGSPALPAAVIDRKTSALQIDNWASTAVRLMQQPTPLEISAEANLSADGKTIEIDVDMNSISNLTGKLQVWIVESDIVAYQLDNGTNVMDYVHNHVLRAVVNGTWGQDVKLSMNEPTTVSYSYAFNSKWNPEHVSVVAFVYNGSGVVQTAECELQL